MRKLSGLFIVIFLAPAFCGATTTVQYLSNTETCPANSSLNGSLCKCDVGYIASGSACVPDPSMPTGQYVLYQDIRAEIDFNPDLSCAQLGIIVATDLDMCMRYRATPVDNRSAWTVIPRPPISSSVVTITNPWAPAGQQVLSNVIAAATSAPATTTSPTSTDVASSTPTSGVSANQPLPDPKILGEIAAASAAADAAAAAPPALPLAPLPPPVPAPAPSPVVASAVPPPPVAPASDTDAQKTMDISPTLPGLVPISDSPRSSGQQDDFSASSSDAHPSLFSRFFGWFFSWL